MEIRQDVGGWGVGDGKWWRRYYFLFPIPHSPSYCFSKTTVSSVCSPLLGDCVTIFVIVLPSAERVSLRLKKPPSDLNSITRASPSHLALVFAVRPMTSCSVSLPSVVYLA